MDKSNSVAESYRHALRKACRQILRKLAALADKGANKKLHSSRIAMKRLRALLPVISTEDAYLSPLKEIWSLSGQLRNLQVQKKFLENISVRNDLQCDDLLQFVRAKEKKMRKRLSRAIKNLNAGSVKASLKKLIKKAARAEASLIESSVNRISHSHLTDIRELSGKPVTPKSVHELRRKLKALHDLNSLQVSFSSSDLKRDNTLQMAALHLGDWHDCEVALHLIDRWQKQTLSDLCTEISEIIHHTGARHLSQGMHVLEGWLKAQ